jgi:hypothetical protein
MAFPLSVVENANRKASGTHYTWMPTLNHRHPQNQPTMAESHKPRVAHHHDERPPAIFEGQSIQ